MRWLFAGFVLLSTGACAPRSAALSSQGAGDNAAAARPVPDAVAALVVEFDRMAAMPLWPRFDPRVTPLAIFDGASTWLFRHPSPPSGFAALAGSAAVAVMAGRHPAIVANSSADIGGAGTATLIPDFATGTPRNWAAVIVHEAFHVFQRASHKSWSGNEVELFTYPVDRADALTLRRTESAALARALTESDLARSRCWARGALAARTERFRLLGAGPVDYERGTELNEGLAAYIQARAAGSPLADVIPAREFRGEEVRLRAYASGAALAHLLDRHLGQWREILEVQDAQFLDVMLSDALSRETTPPCTIPADQRTQFAAAALGDVAAIRVQRDRALREFEGNPGWRLIVVAAGAPLFPQGFDPLNVRSLTDGRILHTRFVRLGGDRGAIEVMGLHTMTEGAGAHPLFNGVRRASIAGLPAEPWLQTAGDSTIVTAAGLRAAFVRATITRDGRTMTLTLPQ